MNTKYRPDRVLREMDACDYIAQKVIDHTDITDLLYNTGEVDYHGIISAAIHYLMEEEVILDADYILYQKEKANESNED
jgi:hypothetical protein